MRPRTCTFRLSTWSLLLSWITETWNATADFVSFLTQNFTKITSQQSSGESNTHCKAKSGIFAAFNCENDKNETFLIQWPTALGVWHVSETGNATGMLFLSTSTESLKVGQNHVTISVSTVTRLQVGRPRNSGFDSRQFFLFFTDRLWVHPQPAVQRLTEEKWPGF
jgi:hypothetical protein